MLSKRSTDLMTPPPSPKNPVPKPGSPPPGVRFALPTGAIWLSSLSGGEPEPELLAAGLKRCGQRDAGDWVAWGASSERAWVKGGRLSWKSALRHSTSRAFLGRSIPRLQEMGNLLELIERGLPAAEPLLAGVQHNRWGQPTMQFLATREVPGSVDLEAYLKGATSEQRVEVAASAGHLASRMHQAGFVHHNYYLRNLVRQPGGALTILDPWRGDFSQTASHYLTDLAGFVADAGPLLAEPDVERFLEAYGQESSGSVALPGHAVMRKATDLERRRIEKRNRRRRNRRS